MVAMRIVFVLILVTLNRGSRDIFTNISYVSLTGSKDTVYPQWYKCKPAIMEVTIENESWQPEQSKNHEYHA